MKDVILVVGASAPIVPERISEIIHDAAGLGYNFIVKDDMEAATTEELPIVLLGDANHDFERRTVLVGKPDRYVIAAPSFGDSFDGLPGLREEIRREQNNKRDERALNRASIRQTNRLHDQRLRQYGKFSNRHK